jgi:DNA-binding CsgD family transcriptional regulator
MPDPEVLPHAVSSGVGSPDTSPALLVVDDDCHCIEAGLGACRLLGVSREEVVGQRFEELLASNARERFRHVWNAFREAGGHAGPFLLAAGTRSEANITVTARVLPSRHLLVLTPTGQERVETNGRPAASHRGPHRGRRRPDPTSRERQVLRLLASGATDVQIASWLSLSPATVQTHVRNAKAKLGARTRAQAVALALQRGMISSG